MHGTIQKGLRYGAALVLAMALCATAALAAGTEGKRLVPVGHTVGVKLFARGVVVVKLPEGGTPARTCGLKTGDVIVECGGEAVTSTEQFQSLLQKNGTDATALEIKRQGSPLTLSVEPERNEQGICCIGAWIRDSMAGIGTVTYYDPATGAFGALGHGITDGDTMALMPFGSGSILPSTVKAVKKGSSGSAGELRERATAATERYHAMGDSIKAAEARLTEIAILKTHIINYAKTREVYAAYRKAGYSKAFLEAHREEITLHKAAKTAFDEAGLQKLPKVKELDAEFAELLTKKKAAYPDYRKARNEMQELVRAQKNVERFFAEEKGTTEKTQTRYEYSVCRHARL